MKIYKIFKDKNKYELLMNINSLKVMYKFKLVIKLDNKCKLPNA